jgi:AcrR family transcriptional regulator
MFKKKMNDVHTKAAVRQAALRDALIDAAETRIATAGLTALKARDLAHHVGCAVGAIYNVVEDLDALIIEVNARTMTGLDAHVRAAAARHENAGPAALLAALADAYLDYAEQNRRRWDALFTHRMPPGRTAPDWFWLQQAALFARVEAPLAALRPGLPAAELTLLARTVFSAVHGIVSLGLDQRIANLDSSALRTQLRLVMTALADGLPNTAKTA